MTIDHQILSPSIPNKTAIHTALENQQIAILPPMDVKDSFRLIRQAGITPKVTILDPWYNKGFGGMRDDYNEFILDLLKEAAILSEHVFLWGFPEIIARFVDKIPEPLTLVAWLTWYYKNNPSVIRGWRSSQNACLHLSQPDAPLYPEHFLNEAQKNLKSKNKLRYMPGPTSVIEEPLPTQLTFVEPEQQSPDNVIESPLLVGFVGKKEQTGHPAQKPVAVFEKLILMTSQENDLIFDPMSGSGTAAVAAKQHNRRAIIADYSEEYTQLGEARVGISRITL